MNKKNSPLYRHRGFTLIELLTVIAIIGILAGIIFPATGAVRRSANNTKSRTQFTNWVAAIETFRSEYRYYPTFGSSNGLISLRNDQDRNAFIETLSGRTLAGARPTSEAARQNRRFIGFYSFGDGEFLMNDSTGTRTNFLADAFDNVDIVIAVDNNLSGRVFDGNQSPQSVAPGNTVNTSFGSPLSLQSQWTDNVRAGAVVYSAGSGRDSRNIVRTWGN
jgi:prepilin-type N-terminal cleavage/methylation domain-containing protein